MIALVALALQAAATAPVPSPPIEVLPVAAAGLATRVTFDAGGAITGCTTAVHGLTGPVDGCLLFAKPALLAHLLGRPIAGLGWATVRLDGAPEGAAAAQAGANRRLLAEAVVTIGADGTITRCAPAAAPIADMPIDLCALMPKGGAFFMPSGRADAHRLTVSFAVESGKA